MASQFNIIKPTKEAIIPYMHVLAPTPTISGLLPTKELNILPATPETIYTIAV